MLEFVRIYEGSQCFDEAVAIYESSFPEAERIPVDEIIRGYDGLDCRFEAVYDDGMLSCIVFTVSDGSLLFLYYLATRADLRSKGIGGRVLETVYARGGLPMALNVELVDPSYEDHEIRARRRDFYLRHGFSDTGRVLVDEQGSFNVLCRGEFDADRYLRFLNSFGTEDCRYLRSAGSCRK